MIVAKAEGEMGCGDCATIRRAESLQEQRVSEMVELPARSRRRCRF